MRCSISAMQFRPSPRPWLWRCARRVHRQRECHLYFARRVSSLSCADISCRRPIKMSPLCQLEMTLPREFECVGELMQIEGSRALVV